MKNEILNAKVIKVNIRIYEKDICIGVAGFSNISIQWTAPGTTAVKTTDFTNDIQIFPNPSGKLFRVKGNNITKIEVLSISGTFLFLNDNNSQIDLGNFSKGIYLARIKTGDETVIKKLVKE